MANPGKLTPAEQASLFELLRKQGSQPTSGGMSTDVPDTQAQAGVNSMGQPLSDLQMQEGDKMHPGQAIQMIGRMLGPQKPSGIELTGGPQLQSGADGTLSAMVERNDPIGKLFGLKQKVGVPNSNFYSAIQNLGAQNLLPNNLARMPDGTPYVDEGTFKTIAASKQLPTPNNPSLDRDTAVALKILTPDQADKLFKTPGQTMPLNELRLGVLADMASTRKGTLELGRNKFEQDLIKSSVDAISDAKQSNSSVIGQQAMKLNNVIHARQLLTQAFNADTGEYDLPKAASSEVIMGVARAISPTGQLSEQVQNDLSSPTAYGRIAALLQYATGRPINANPQELTKMYRDMLDRQGAISQDLFNASAARQLPKLTVLQKTNPVAYAAVLQNSFGTHDYRSMVSSGPDGQVSVIPEPINLGGRGQQPPAVPKQVTGAWRVIR